LGPTDTAITNGDGEFEVGITHELTKTMPFRLEVSKEGFVGHEERLTGTAGYPRRNDVPSKWSRILPSLAHSGAFPCSNC
jgi:hypothetical protein